MQNLPTVSICTLTYNRPRRLKQLLHCIESQDYPLDLVEWLILDDSDSYPNKTTVSTTTGLTIKYQKIKEKLILGRKRNLSHRLCSGDLIIYMDDDDYYFPTRISHAVSTFSQSSLGIAGSTILPIYFEHDQQLWISGPFNKNHATANTFAMTREFARDHQYDDNAGFNEERSLLDDYTKPMAQLNPWETIICISHQTNTFDKKKMRASGQSSRMKPASPEDAKKALKALSTSGYINTKGQGQQIHSTNHQKIALISGPWGSGTTAVCEVVSKLGIQIPGPHFRINDPQTPNSYETLTFNRLIHSCVNEQDLSRKAPPKEVISRLTQFSERMNTKEGGDMIALKTPASSVIINELAETFELSLIICLRDYSDIESSRARRGWPAHFGSEGAKKIYAQINEFIARTNTPFLFVRYSDLTSQATIRKTVNEIIRFLNIHPSNESIDNAIASIRTHYSVIKKPLT